MDNNNLAIQGVNVLIALYQQEQIAFSYAIWMGFLSCFFVMVFDLEKGSKRTALYFILAFSSFAAPVMYSIFSILVGSVLYPKEGMIFPRGDFYVWGACFAGGIIGTLVWKRFMQPRVNNFLDSIKKDSDLLRNTRTDVRTVAKDHLPEKALEFDPSVFFDESKGIFLGLSEKSEPVYLDMGGSTSAPHVQVVGTTGGGKGISLGVMAAQFLMRDEAVFFCDPKNDEWAPHVLYSVAKKAGKPFHYVDLNRPNGPQFNPVRGGTEEEIFELLQAGFSLTEKGDASDFYGIADRREASITAKLMAQKGMNFAEAYAERREILESKETGAEKFAGRLRELAETPSINAANGQGVDLEKVVALGGCVYFVGSMRNDIVKTVQRILLVRFIQLAERRDRMAGNLRKICVVLDEVKYHLSRPALEGLGAARDKGVHFILAHQSVDDLRDCPKDLNPDAVVGGVVENCSRKLCYKLMNPITAEWMAAMSGIIQVDDETRQVRRNVAQAETILPERSIRQAERYFMDTNMLMNLPKSVGVLYGDGLAKFVSIQPMKTEKDRAAITIKTCAGAAAPTTRDAISLD